MYDQDAHAEKHNRPADMIALRTGSIRVQKAKAKNKRRAECDDHLDKQKRNGKARYWVPAATLKTSRWVEIRSPNAVSGCE